MDIQKDARRLATIGTFFVVVGWIAVIYALVAGLLWWIDLAQREAFNIFEAFAISATAIGCRSSPPSWRARYFLRLFALSVASQTVTPAARGRSQAASRGPVGLVLVVAACSAGSEGTGGQLEGTRWVLRSYCRGRQSDAPPGDATPTRRSTASRVRASAAATRSTRYRAPAGPSSSRAPRTT